MDRLGFSISDEDHKLLTTQFHVDNPQTLPDLRRDIPDDASIQAVQFAYQITASLKQKSRWIRCCECRRENNHKRGVVLLLGDGTRATVGRDCGREEHDLDFDLLIKEFDGRLHRTRLLRQTIATLEHVSVVQEFLRTMRQHPAIRASRNARREMASRLPEFFRLVQSAAEGRITAKFRVRDFEAEKQRGDRLERKLAEMASRRRVSRDDAEVDKALFDELVAAGDKDASKDPIHSVETRTLYRVRGHGFLSLPSEVGLRAERLDERLLACFAELRGKSSKKVTDRRMELIRKEFGEVVDEAEKLHAMVRDALVFVEPSNLAALVRATNKLFKADARLIEYEDGVLRKVSSPGETSVRLALPAFDLSTAALSRVRRAVQAAFTESGETEADEVATSNGGPLPWIGTDDGSGMDAHHGPA